MQSRSPVVPITVGASNPVVYLGAQDGYVYALDGAQGGAALRRGPRERRLRTVVQAAPAGIFTAFGGAYDYLLVGTRDATADNVFVALDPETRAVLATFNNGGGAGGIGIINGTAAVDYATRARLLHEPRAGGGSANTLWCLRAQGRTDPVFTPAGWTPPRSATSTRSPVLRGGRIYVGSSAGRRDGLLDRRRSTGSADRTFVHLDGQVKGFVFPDRNSDDIYFATDNFVWGVSDTGAAHAREVHAGG